jgi:hypothetical protein
MEATWDPSVGRGPSFISNNLCDNDPMRKMGILRELHNELQDMDTGNKFKQIVETLQARDGTGRMADPEYIHPQ